MKNEKMTRNRSEVLAAPAVRAGQAFTLSEAVSTSKIALAYSETETENASGATTCIKIEDSIGIDEVGRGPLAGPVVSAAVWICADLARYLEDNSKILPVRDSKKMTRKQRQKIVDWIDSCPSDQIKYSIGCATVEEIDELNILNASLLSMERAYNGVCGTGIFSYPALVLVDGNVAPDIKGVEIKTIVKGDDKVLSISLASIIAKEYRDNYMRNLSEQFPHYSWDTNVGYGTAAHLQAIAKYGITPHHRKSFAPVSQLSLPLD